MSKILVAIDDGQAVRPIVHAVGKMVARSVTEATVLHVRERQPRGTSWLLKTDAEGLVEAAVIHLGEMGIRAAGRLYTSLPGCVPSAIVAIAAEEGVQAIVLGTYRRSRLSRWLGGSVSRGVIHRTAVPVITVPLGWWQQCPITKRGPDDDSDNVLTLNFKLQRPNQPVA